jgi:glutathione peroxidase-family protein
VATVAGWPRDRVQVSATDFFELSSRKIEGDHLSFEQFRGSVCLVVNVASS